MEENSKPQTMEEDDAQLTKPKKPRSEKQMIAFQQAMSKRKENIEKRKEEKLIKASEILVKANATKPVATKSTQQKEVKQPKIIIPQDSESETDEEVIIVKSKPKPKKKVKKIIIEDSSDDDSSIDSDGSKEYNKKLYTKSKRRDQPISIHRESLIERPKPVFNSANFFI